MGTLGIWADSFTIAQEKSGEYECTIFANEIARRNKELQNLYEEIELLVKKIEKEKGYERIEQMQEDLHWIKNTLAELSSSQATTMNSLEGGV